MTNKKQADSILNSQANDNSLPDGNYLTCPKWGYSEREVVAKDGKVSLASDGRHIFTQYWFFQANDVIESLPL